MMLFAALVLIATILCYAYFRQCYAYWRARGVPTYPAPRIPLGHCLNPLAATTSNQGLMFEKFYRYFKTRGAKHAGVYMITTPVYMPIELDLIKDIMTKHFDHFTEKGMFYNEAKQPVSAHLFQVGGERWRRLRVKLTPTFTSGKMRMMFSAVVACARPLVTTLRTATIVDMKAVCVKYTIDVIGVCAFGIDCDSFRSEEFVYYGTRVFATNTRRAVERNLQLYCPRIARLLGLLPFAQDVVDFFVHMITETVKMRETQAVKRNDFMQLLVELKNKPTASEAITMNEVLSEGWLFFNAGFETSSTTMSYAMYELAKHPRCQELAREECQQVYAACNECWQYDALSKLQYIDQIICETLRLYPPVTILNRECSRDFAVDDVIIAKGTKIFIPAYAIQRDEEYYPNPEEFVPERFAPEEKRKRHPYAWLPFGEGPRICIGMRFAMMQTKLGIAELLRNYRFALAPDVPTRLTFDKGFILSANERLNLTVTNL